MPQTPPNPLLLSKGGLRALRLVYTAGPGWDLRRGDITVRRSCLLLRRRRMINTRAVGHAARDSNRYAHLLPPWFSAADGFLPARLRAWLKAIETMLRTTAP